MSQKGGVFYLEGETLDSAEWVNTLYFSKYIFSIDLSNELSWYKLKEPVSLHERKLKWEECILRDVAQIKPLSTYWRI